MSDNEKKPREYFGNWMAMDVSLQDAKDISPKAEHQDIRCYVEKSDFEAVVKERDELEQIRKDLLQSRRNAEQGRDKLRAELDSLKDTPGGKRLYAAMAEIEKLKAELEFERLRLAGCGVAAMQNTEESKSKRITKENPHWSASYGDVCDAVDREIQLRADLALAVEALEFYAKQTSFPLKDIIDVYEERGSTFEIISEFCETARTSLLKLKGKS